MQQISEIEQIIQTACNLSPFEKIELVKIMISDIQNIVAENQRKPLNSVYGICADYQPEPSEEDIAQMRKEVFREFSEGDI